MGEAGIMKPPKFTRRLSDKILWAFGQAIETDQLEVAGILMQALELALTTELGAGFAEKRQDFDEVVAAYVALKERKARG